MSPTESDGVVAPLVDYKPRSKPDVNDPGQGKRDRVEGHPSSVLTLDPSEASTLMGLAATLAPTLVERPDAFCIEAALRAARLSPRVRRHLIEFSHFGTQEGYLLIRGLPQDPTFPPTPPDNTHHLGERTLMARGQAIINHVLGEMIAYEAEGGGRLFQDMVPSRQAAATQTSLGSRVELELHTEQAFSRQRPDWVSLSCARGARNAATYVLSAKTLISALEPSAREMLREPLWTTQVDESFRDADRKFIDGSLRGPFSILQGSDEDPFLRFDQDLDWGISRQAEKLRQRIIELYPQLRRSHTLAPGEMLLVDNLRAVHGRSPFAARFDGSGRFIIRSFVVRDLAKSRQARPGNGRVIAADYS
jgi:L-asparagine oxygenase